MKLYFLYFFISLLFFGCSQRVQIPERLSKKLPNTYLLESSFTQLPNFKDENYENVLKEFINNCQTEKSQKLYGSLCEDTDAIRDAKTFFTTSFKPYVIQTKKGKKKGILTGYYEAELQASMTKTAKYKYPIYKTPKDLIVVHLSSIYPELKHYRLRGRIKGNKLIPYDTRRESKKKDVNADVICYCDSKIDRFFLEIQGSGKVHFDDNSTIFIGYDNQNGYKYRAIGKALVKRGALELEDVSLQSIKKWLEDNPSRVDEILNYNKSLVYFQQREQGATGALGLELHAKRSIAVDRRYIPLGSMLYMSADVKNRQINRFVFAQDTGGAIKGSVRADLFLGSGDKALDTAGRLNAPLKLWILLPKQKKKM